MLLTAILVLAVALNIKDKESLLLTLVVGFSMLLPMHMLKEHYYLWYGVCIGSELLKIVLSIFLCSRLKYPIMFLSGLMLTCHTMSMYLDDFTLPYRTAMPILEYFEILVCILFSTPILIILMKEFKCRLKL
jgi:uncharacterized protein YhhL (DUF1145 family)